MYTLCTTEKTAQQQRQFEKAFLELALEIAYDDLTVSELCRKAGLSRKIFYRLFERKGDVLYALVDHTLLDASVHEPDISVKEGGLHRFLDFWRSQKDLLDVLHKNKGSALLTDSAIQLILHEGSEFSHCLGLNDTKFGRQALAFYISGIFALVLDWHKQDFAQSIDELSEALMYLLTTPPVKHPLLSDPCVLDPYK